MNDAERLLVTLGVFYALECAYWVRPGWLVFVSHSGERHRMTTSTSGSLLRNDRGGLVLGNLLPWGTSMRCQAWPIGLSPDGVYTYAGQAFRSDVETEEHFIRFEDMGSIETDLRCICVNGTRFVPVVSAELARRLAVLVQELASLIPLQRGPAIEAALADMLHADEFHTRYARACRQSRVLGIACGALFVYTFGLLPMLLWSEVPCRFLHVFLGYCFLLCLIMANYFAAHRTLQPAGSLTWWKQWAILTVSPADALHARDSIFRNLGSAYHPLAVAQALCSRSDWLAFATQTLLDLRHPSPALSTPETLRGAAEAWFRKKLTEAVEESLKQAGLDPEELVRPPQRESPSCRSYCPRCHGQFVHAEGICPYCSGIRLEAFSDEAPGMQGDAARPRLDLDS